MRHVCSREECEHKDPLLHNKSSSKIPYLNVILLIQSEFPPFYGNIFFNNNVCFAFAFLKDVCGYDFQNESKTLIILIIIVVFFPCNLSRINLFMDSRFSVCLFNEIIKIFCQMWKFHKRNKQRGENEPFTYVSSFILIQKGRITPNYSSKFDKKVKFSN